MFFGGVEKLFQSLEGSTDYYDEREGKIIPILKPYEYADDNVIINYIKDFQKELWIMSIRLHNSIFILKIINHCICH